MSDICGRRVERREQCNRRQKAQPSSLGYIGEEIEGQLPEAYYDVHASQFLMTVMVIARMLPAVATYFCDTFLWYTCYASVFTIFLQWRGKVSHAQQMGELLRDFQQIPNLFCEKVLNKSWPKPVILTGDAATSGDASGDSDDDAFGAKEQRYVRAVATVAATSEGLLDSVALTVVEDEVLIESGVKTAAPNPADFLPEAMDVKWQHFSRGWNSIVDSLRARDHITNKECTDLKFVFLQVVILSKYLTPRSTSYCPRCSPLQFSRGQTSTLGRWRSTLLSERR